MCCVYNEGLWPLERLDSMNVVHMASSNPGDAWKLCHTFWHSATERLRFCQCAPCMLLYDLYYIFNLKKAEINEQIQKMLQRWRIMVNHCLVSTHGIEPPLPCTASARANRLACQILVTRSEIFSGRFLDHSPRFFQSRKLRFCGFSALLQGQPIKSRLWVQPLFFPFWLRCSAAVADMVGWTVLTVIGKDSKNCRKRKKNTIFLVGDADNLICLGQERRPAKHPV